MFDFKTFFNFVLFTKKFDLIMNLSLSRKQIGQRIAELRKTKGLSQNELAKYVNISRPSLAQIELGKRSIDIIEMQKFSQTLGFSLDDFVSKGFAVQSESNYKEKIKPMKAEERISTPTFQPNKFKNVLLYILEFCAGKSNVGETVLYKLLYFSDFNYYELYEEHLTGSTYRKLPYGPAPQEMDAMISQMVEMRQLQRVKTEYHGYQQTRYLPLEKANLTELKASEKEVIDRVIDQMSDWSAAMISEYSHKDLPWAVTDEGKEISYELSFYRELPYSVRVYDEDEND